MNPLAFHKTPTKVANLMASLCQNQGRFLDPCCGDGALTEALTDQNKLGWRYGLSIELDPQVAPDYALVQDFFSFPVDQKFSSVIANPPYLRNREIPKAIRELPMFQQLEAVLDGYANMYHFFIVKCFYHLEPNGEMVFVVPEEIFRSTGSAKLMQLLHTRGTFSDIIHFRKSPFLPEVSQEVLVFRYVKGDLSHQTNVRIEE